LPLPDDYLGVSESVVRAGVPAVVAFRQTLSDDGGVRFALEFYKGEKILSAPFFFKVMS
jgi:hypothetical protein